MAYFPHQKRLAETACVPSSQRSNYSPAIRTKKPNFSLANSGNFPQARFRIVSGLPTTRELGVSFLSSCWRVAAT